MKKYILILISACCFSQNNNYKVTYELIRKKNDFEFNAKAVLEVDVNNKLSNFKLSQYQNLLKSDKKLYDEKSNDSIKVLSASAICTDNKIYYHDFKKDSISTLLYDVNCKSKVLIKDKINYPKWSIKQEFKEISGYKTQKAVCTINDRTWTVYFTNDLKLNFAPWRLIGLPGAILEATEDTNVYEFKFTGIEKWDENLKNSKPSFKTKSTFDQFVKKSIKQNQEQMFFMLSQMEGVTQDAIDVKTFPAYETIDFVEKK